MELAKKVHRFMKEIDENKINAEMENCESKGKSETDEIGDLLSEK